MQRTVAVISAGLGVPSTTRMLADQLAADVVARSAQQNIEVVLDVIELREHATDIANAMVAGYAGPALAQVIERVAAADAMIAVTPTFSASYSGLFKSFFDVLDPKSLEGMPVLFGATGGSSRHSLVLEMAIRPLFSYLRANTMPTAIYASPEDWAGSGSNPLDQRSGQGAAELSAVLGAPLQGGTTPEPGSAAPTSAVVPWKGDGAGDAAGNGAGEAMPGNREKRALREAESMTSLPFEELLAQTRRR